MPTPPNVVWKGSKDITRVGRGRWRFSPLEVTCTLEYKGPYDTCLANVPLLGNVITGYTAYGVKVDNTALDESDGSTCLMTVTLKNPNTDMITRQGASGSAPAAQSGQAGDSMPSLHWQPFKRKIESHPLCGTNTAVGTAAAVTQDGHIDKANYKAVDGGWTYDQYLSLLKGGQTEYDEPQPLLALTTQWYTKPTTFGTNNFGVDTPPADQGLAIPSAPIGGGQWVWVRGGDELSRQDKRWQFHQSWTGFRPGADLTLHNLLYGTGTGGGSSSGGGDGS